MTAEHGPTGGTHSHMSGTAGNVVQAGNISGGVHFHSPGSAALVPRQLPGGVRDFINRVIDLNVLDRVLTPGAPDSTAGSGPDTEPGSNDAAHSGSRTICVIAGGAGVGKTSLAVHWGHRTRTHFPDGQLHINLRAYDPNAPVGPEQALSRFLEALGVPAASQPYDLDTRAALFRTLMADKKMLLVLDNADRPAQVRPLLPGSPGCRVLITTRDQMSGLVTHDGAHRHTLGLFGEPEAVTLLRTTIAPYRQDETTDIAELARLCARLPLALRIAAERAASRPHMPLAELIDDLRHESSLWDALSTPDDADAVRTVFAWSYRALPADAARLFRLLGLHPGPEFSQGAAAALAGLPSNRVRRLLDILLNAHLVEQTASDRYQSHDLLRAYAADQAASDGGPEESQAAIQRVLSWYLQATLAVQRIAPYEQAAHRPPFDAPDPEIEVPAFADYPTAFAWFRTERQNLVAAATAAVRHGLDHLAWQLPAAATFLYAKNAFFDDWFSVTRPGLEAAERDRSLAGQAAVLASLGMACRQVQRPGEASEYYRAALQIHREQADTSAEVWVLNLLGHLHCQQRNLDEAERRFTQALDLCAARDMGLAAGFPTAGLALTRLRQGRLADAVSLYQQAYTIHQGTGDHSGQWDVLHELSAASLADGQSDAATDYARQALELAEVHDNDYWCGQAATALGVALLASDRPEEALVHLHRAAGIQARLGDHVNEVTTIAATAQTLTALHRWHEAADFYSWAATLYALLGDTHQQCLMSERAESLRERPQDRSV